MLLNILKSVTEYNKEIERIISKEITFDEASFNINQLIALDNIRIFELPSVYKKSLGAMQNTLNKLIDLGLIIKYTNYCQDKRRVKFEITENGKYVLDQVNNIDKQFIKRINTKLMNSFKSFSK